MVQCDSVLQLQARRQCVRSSMRISLGEVIVLIYFHFPALVYGDEAPQRLWDRYRQQDLYCAISITKRKIDTEIDSDSQIL